MITIKLAPYEDNKLPNRSFARTYNEWCMNMFGKPFQGMNKRKDNLKWVDMRWCQYNTSIRFKKEEDAVLFLLKWG